MGVPPDIAWTPLLFLVLLAAVWFPLNRRLFDDWLSPFSVLFLAWIMPLSLQAMNLSGAETVWSTRGVLVVAWTTLTLTAVCLAAYPFVGRRRDPVETYERTLRLVGRPAFVAAFAVVFAGVAAVYVYVEFATNPAGVPLLTLLRGGALPFSTVHRWGKESSLQAIVALLAVLTPLAYLAFRAARGRVSRTLLLAAAAFYPVGGVLKLSRSDVFIALLGLAVAAACHRRCTQRVAHGRGAWVAVVLVMAGAGVVMYAMMSIRLLGVGVDELYADFIEFRLADVPFRGPIATVYGYVALPFENLNRFMTYHGGLDLYPGISVLRPPLSASGLSGLADAADARVFYPAAVSAAAGSATFLTAVYAELGLVGAAVVPALYALLVNAVYIGQRRSPTIVGILLYALFIYPWAWLFFNNGFGVLSVHISAAFVIGLGLVAPFLGRPTVRPVAAPSPAL
jgi:oligosaccharide repeat unit polymerase